MTTRMDAARAHQKRTAHALFQKAEPSSESWWLNKNRDELSDAERHERDRMSKSKYGRLNAEVWAG